MTMLSVYRAARAVAAAALIFSASTIAVRAQEGPVISARAGQRQPRPLPAAAADGVHLSLNDAVGLALANNEDINVVVNAAEASGWTLFQNTGIFDPLLQASVTRSHAEQRAISQIFGAKSDTFTANAQVTQLAPWGGVFSVGFQTQRSSNNAEFNVINPAYQSGLTLNLTQPLLRNFGKLSTTWLIQIARNNRDSTYQGYVRGVQTAVNGVEQAYWDLVYAIQNLEVKKESLTIAQDLNRITKIKIDVGSLAPIDITQTEVGIATAEQDIITAEGLIGDAQDRLKRLMNFDPKQWTVPVVPTDSIRSEPVKIDVEQGTQTALDRRPEILSQGYLTEADRVRWEYYKNQTLPRLDLLGTYGRGGTAGIITDPNTGQVIETTGVGSSLSQIFTENFPNWSIGLQFSYPLFNRTARGAREAARFTFEASRATLSTVEQNVLVDVRSAARAIDTAQRQIVAAEKGRELAEKNLDAEKKKFDNGMSTTFQVNQIQRDLSAARTTELQALVVFRKAIAAYHFSTADILEWKGVRIEGVPETTRPPLEPVSGPEAPR